MTHPETKTQKIVWTALLTASTIVLARFIAIRTPILTINFAFAPIMLAGLLMGWRSSTFVAVVADLIGALLFPSGSFFIGYTLTALLKGLSAGLLYRPAGIKIDRQLVIRLIILVLIWSVVLNGLLNTLWIFITTGGAGNVIVPVRVAKQLIMAPIEVIVMLALARLCRTERHRAES